MSKKPATAATAPTPASKPAEGKAPAGGAPAGGGGGHHAATLSAPKSKTAAGPAVPGGCLAQGCKAQAKRFNFCNEHYDHFKFGLIKKTGEQVPDYEKKIEHYMAHQRGQSGQQQKQKRAA